MNTDKKDLGAQLAYAALDEVPTAKADAKEIVGLVKSSGRVSGYQLPDGTEKNNLGNLPSVSKE